MIEFKGAADQPGKLAVPQKLTTHFRPFHAPLFGEALTHDIHKTLSLFPGTKPSTMFGITM